MKAHLVHVSTKYHAGHVTNNVYYLYNFRLDQRKQVINGITVVLQIIVHRCALATASDRKRIMNKINSKTNYGDRHNSKNMSDVVPQ